MPTLLEERQLSRSALHTQVSTPRASRAKQKHEPHTTGGPWLVYLVLGGLLAVLLLWVGQTLLNWVNTTVDDVRYGRPRTTQVDHFVGHSVGSAPSHFIATNINGQVYVIEIPGGQPSQSHLLIGPHLIGPGTELAPVTLSFVGDPHTPDLVVSISGVQIRFHNTGTSYVPASS